MAAYYWVSGGKAEIFLTYGISVNRMRRNSETYSNKYEAYALLKANPAFAIYKFHKGKIGWGLHLLMKSGLLYHWLQETWKMEWEEWRVGQGAGASAISSCGSQLVLGPLEQKTPTLAPPFVMTGDSSSHQNVISWIVRHAKCLSWWQRCLG